MMRAIVIVNVLVLVLVLVIGCGGGDDGGGGGGGADAGQDEPDGGGGGGGWDQPADGQFTAVEQVFGTGGVLYASVMGSFVHPRPRYHELAAEEGECRLWLYHVEACDEECELSGTCDASGTCLPFPEHVSAGDVTIGAFTLEDTEYGYVPAGDSPGADLFDPGEAVPLTAEGGDAVGAFSLDAAGVDPIETALEEAGGGEEDSLVLDRDGGDRTITWTPGEVAGTRVRLEILTRSSGHGLPVHEIIECESPDDGSITVPGSLIAELPEQPYQNICAGIDCPPSSISRFTEDRKTVEDHDVALRVGFQQYFLLVVNGG